MASRDAPSLILTAASPGFTTQGSINWTDLAGKSVDASVGVLSRVAAAGVDPYTLIVGQKLGSLFQLTSEGRTNIITALKQLRTFKGVAKFLEFGFGLSHLVRVLARTEEGMMCLSLCAALAECYDTMLAAEILVEMIKTSEAPRDLQPSILEWQALLQACVGTLAMTRFPLLAEQYMQLHPTDRAMTYEPMQGGFSERGCSSPSSIAKALLAIAQVSRSSLESITITGGADAGFLAAFAEWHFQIPFRIIHGFTGKPLHIQTRSQATSSHDRAMPKRHVDFIFEDRRGQTDMALELSDRTYRLQNATTLIQFEINSHFGGAFVGGRVSWGNILATCFGPELKLLLECQRAVGGLLGCLCTIAAALACVEDGRSHEVLSPYRYYAPESYGRGLCNSLLTLFPEITPIKRQIEEAGRQTTTQPLAAYESHLLSLRLACNCTICQGKPAAQEGYCAVLVLELMVVIAQTMSMVSAPSELMPSRLGLEIMYNIQVELRTHTESHPLIEERIEVLGPAAHALVGHGDSSLYMALTLFGGRRLKRLDSLDTCASVMGGICGFWSTLCTFGRQHIPMGGVSILPGQIEFHKKSYSTMLDSKSEFRPFVADGKPTFLDKQEVAFMVQEKAVALHVRYELLGSDRGDGRLVEIPLAFSNFGWCRYIGLVECEGKRKCASTDDFITLRRTRGIYSLYAVNDMEIEVYEPATILQAVVLTSAKRAKHCSQFVVDRQCLHCCLRAAHSYMQRLGQKGAVVIRVEDEIPTLTGNMTAPLVRGLVDQSL